MACLSKIRRKAKSAERAAAEASTTTPKVRATKSGRSVLKSAPSGRTCIQKAAGRISKPETVDGELRASDEDVLRIADAIAEQRKELMDRLAQ